MARAVVWIGGSTGSGKTTVTRILAARHGLRVFPIDAFWYSHVARLGESEPGPDEQWLGRSPHEQAADFEALTRRRWPLVLADLAALPPSPPVIVEGPQVLPDLVPAGDRAVFLIGTAAWQRAILERRPLPATADPYRALANRIEKDRLFGERIVAPPAARDFPVVEIDGSRSVSEIAGKVTGLPEPDLGEPDLGEPDLGEPDPDVPGPDVPAARRWENRVVAGNLRSWLRTSHVPPDLPAVYAFVCECGRPSCTASVLLSLAEVEAGGPVIADGH